MSWPGMWKSVRISDCSETGEQGLPERADQHGAKAAADPPRR